MKLSPEATAAVSTLLVLSASLARLLWANRKRLMKALEDNAEVKSLATAVEALDSSLNAVSRRLSVVEADNAELRRMLAETEAELAEVRQQRDAHKERIAELESQVAALRAELAKREELAKPAPRKRAVRKTTTKES